MTKGVVENITDDVLEVKIKCMSACEACSQRQNCGLTTQPSKKLAVKVNNVNQYNIGQEVDVKISLKTIGMSLVFAYILPLFLVLTVLIISLSLDCSETKSAIYSLLSLIPYYFLLFCINTWLKKQLKIEIQ